MSSFGEIQTTDVSLTLGSQGIQIDEHGRIAFMNPEVVEAFVSAAPAELAQRGGRPATNNACNTAVCTTNKGCTVAPPAPQGPEKL